MKKDLFGPNTFIITKIFSGKKPVNELCGGYIKSVKREKYQLKDKEVQVMKEVLLEY